MISYEKQLDLKRNVVIKAYKNYSGLPQTSVPEIQSTIGSPLQYGYRTKITPHFEISKKRKDEPLKIGFNKVNTKIPLDIEVSFSLFNYHEGILNIITGVPDRDWGYQRRLWTFTCEDSRVRPCTLISHLGSY